MPVVSDTRLESAYRTAVNALLAERTAAGHWVGELSTSALSTATAVMALFLVQRGQPTRPHDALIAGGLRWLAEHQNSDGGWGDTVKSLSNISTTMLCRAAFYLTGTAAAHAAVVARVEAWLGARYGNSPQELAEAVRARYGVDRTFAVPILTTCALAGLVSWDEVPALPFELACLPQAWFRFVRLHVVSYALPALIAIGQAIYHHRPPRNPIARLVRALSRKRSLRMLELIQPSSGGYLEATPLTSFVTLSLAACGLAAHPVAVNAVKFLVRAARPDGSWPIDSNLATWVTTLSINALSAVGDLAALDKRAELRDWLLGQQYRQRHPFTGAAPGGWAWTDLPGGVPDADDTPGALLALAHLGLDDPRVRDAVADGLIWLGELRNADGGWPTFCRGWGHLPFDRSGCDLTAHALRAIALDDHCVRVYASHIFPFDVDAAFLTPGFAYLARTQRPDGSWLPLWFGNQHSADDENPTYGTARVLAAYRDLDRMSDDPAQRGVAWLRANQNADGGWGGGKGTPSTVEETALATEVLVEGGAATGEACNRGIAWLVERVEQGGLHDPSPIGFYFAKLWYYEKLYPIIFTVGALGRALRLRRRHEHK